MPGPKISSLATENQDSNQSPNSNPKNNIDKPAQPTQPVKRPKPLVEGINSPINKIVRPELTPSEQSLVNNSPAQMISPTVSQAQRPRITLMPEMTERPSAKRSSHLGWLLVVLLLATAALVYFLWNARSSTLSNQSQAPAANQMANQSTAPVNQTSPAQAATSSPATSTPAVTPQEVGKDPAQMFAATVLGEVTITKTPTGYLNVRQQPSSSSTLVAKVNPGETYQYTAVKNGWYQIVLKDGTTGWVLGTYAKKQ